MRAYGAKVVLTPAAERASGAVRLAEQLAAERGWFLARQFDNEANPAYHRQTTGPEILSDFASTAARLLGHGLGNRRHADGRGSGHQARAPRDQDRRVRAGRRGAARRQGMEAAQDPGLDARLRAVGARSRRLRRGRRRHRRARRSPARAISRTAKASSAASRRAARSPARSRSPRRPPEGSVHPRDAARHRRALPVDGAVRGRADGLRPAIEDQDTRRAVLRARHPLFVVRAPGRSEKADRRCSPPIPEEWAARR